MKFFAKLKSFLGHTGFYFTLIVMIFNTFITIAYPTGNKVFETKYFWHILLFSAIYALCNFVLDIKFVESYLAKLSVHFILVVLDFGVVIGWLSGAAASQKSSIFVTLAFAFVYLIVEAVRAAVYFSTHKKKNEETEYKNLFS
jgi:hypothetical protein